MTKEEDFKMRLAAVIADLESQGSKDAEAMWLLGSLASELAAQIKAPDWSTAKKKMNRADYQTLLESFQEGGNTHHSEGRVKQAYVIQALAMSLIAPTQPSAEVRQGGQLLDGLIDGAIAFYQRAQKKGA